MKEKDTNLRRFEALKNLIKDKKAKKIDSKNKYYMEKFGITYDEVVKKLPKQKKGEKGYLSTFLSYFYCNAWLWVLFIIFVAVNAVNGYLSAYFLQTLTDFAYATLWEDVFLNLIYLFAVTLTTYLVGGLCSLGFGYIKLKGTEKIRSDLSKRVLNTSSMTYRKLSSGEIISRITKEPTMLASRSTDILYNIKGAISQFTFIFYFLMLDWRLGLSMFVIMLINFFLIYFYLKSRKVINKRAQILNDNHTSFVGEFVRGSDDIKGLNIKKAANNISQNHIKHRFNSALFGKVQLESMSLFNNIFNFVFSTLFLALGVYFIMIGEISFGAISIIILYRNKPEQLSRVLNTLFGSVQDIKISCERMYEIYTDKYPQEKFGDKKIENFMGSVEFKNVFFKYDDDYVLEDLSFVVEPKTSVGIVGKSGQGKSTILSLIPRLYDCSKGQILLDNIDNRSLTEDSLRDNVCLVSQSPYIFNTTIKENLLLAKEDATDEEIEDVLKRAQLFDFVMNKPKKLETIVGEGGIVLSGGQKQRLAIARAFLKNSKLLLFDEATSSLDNENQSEIKKSIDALKGVCTSIIVAHRLSTIIDCDVIYFLDDKKIIASGTHKELLKNCEEYRKLYLQEEKENKKLEEKSA